VATLTFVPPVEKFYASNSHPLLRRVPLWVGVTVLKENGIYREVRDEVDPADIDVAEAVYLGGHEYVISEEEAAELIAAGYGIYIKYSGFGSGFYGLGSYGVPQEGVSNG
jgi:hypothetical protein